MIDGKELAELLGFKAEEGKEAETADVKKYISEKFVAIDKIAERPELYKAELDKAYGIRMKEEEVSIIAAHKAAGLDLTHSEFKDMKLKEISTKIGAKWADKVKASNGTDEEVVKGLKIDLEKKTADLTLLQGNLTTLNKTYTDFKTGVEADQLKSKTGKVMDEAFGKIKWKAETQDFTKVGFRASFNEQYKIEVNEDGKTELRDIENNNRVTDPKDITKFETVSGAVERLAKTAKLWDDSKHNGNKPPVDRKDNKPPHEEYQRPVRRNSPAKRNDLSA